MGARHDARIAAVQLLYELDTRGCCERPDEAIGYFFANFGAAASHEARAFAEQLCRLVCRRIEALDRQLEQSATRWRVARMSRVDRNILRLAALELELGETPAAVVLDEAVRLAQELGGAESGAFVNGVLGRLARGQLRAKPSDPA